MNKPKLIANRWVSPAGEILQSKHRYDFVTDSAGNFIDGGLSYIRIGGSQEGWTDCCVYSDDTHELKRKYFMWGNRGRNGNEPLTWLALKDMETEHIWNIIRDMGHAMQEHILKMFRDEIRLRKDSDS